MTDTLADCPFCGGNNIEEYLEGLYSVCVSCHDCPAMCVKEKWNTRASGWISCKDRLPFEETDYLTIDQGHISLTRFTNQISILKEYWNRHITHWMPLPSPPKESE